MRYRCAAWLVMIAGFLGVGSACAQTSDLIGNIAAGDATTDFSCVSAANMIGRQSADSSTGTPLSSNAGNVQPVGAPLAGSDVGVQYIDGRSCDLPAGCDDCPNHVLMAFVSYDSFKGISDGGWQNNGIVTGFNFGTRLGELSELTGIGFQIGASVGVFNWSGTDYRLDDQNLAQTQGFFTFGLFRRATDTSRWTAAIVSDTMYNNNYGIFAQNPMLMQMRGQLGYCISPWNEIGIWGTWRSFGQTLLVPTVGPTTWQAVQQLNVYLHHKWQAGGPDTWFWIGRPEQSRLTRDGSLGDYLAGASATAPLNDRVSLFALATYMHPSAAPGALGSIEDAWNFTIGLAFFPKPNARSSTVAGRCWMPLMPVANNGYFLVDTNRPFFPN
ncbi:MAG TPA: DUF6666 family protein [Pirellulales bacterium]